MNPILCLTDFSEKTEVAMRVAAALSRETDDPVVLVRSVDERGFFPDYTRRRLVSEDELRLREEAGRLRALGYVFQRSLIGGCRSDNMARLAQRIGAWLVVWAADPLSRLECWAVGCTGEHVAATLRIPLLAVRSAIAFERWAGGAQPLRILVSLAPERDSVALLSALESLQAIGRCEINLVLLAGPRHPDLEASAQFARRMLGGTRASIARAIGPMHLANEVVANATAGQADLIVVGTHPAAEMPLVLLRTLSGCLLRHSSVNVLCVPNAGATFEAERAVIESLNLTLARAGAAT